MRWLIKTNLVFLFTAAILFPFDSFTIGRIARSFIELTFVFFLPGINLAFLLQYFLKRKFTFLELINIALVFSLFLLPLFLTLEYTKFKILFPLLPFINALFIFIFTVGILSFYKKRNLENFPEYVLNNQTLWDTFFSKTFLYPFILYVAVVVSIVTAYYPLPDLDPYYWLTEYQTQFQAGSITLLGEHRPLFSSLTYIFTRGAHTDLYAFFKYVLPEFLLLLIFPSALLAQKFSQPLQKVIIYFFPFISGITLIYLTLPIPQAIANVGLFFFFAFLAYSFITKDAFFYFLGGIILFLGFLYHEALVIPLTLWITVSIWSYRREILRKARDNKLAASLLLFIILPTLYDSLLIIFSRVASLIPSILNSHPNFYFPQYYVNIDGNQMGWGDLSGVAKYYLFYVGPPLLLTFVILLIHIKSEIIQSFLVSREGKVFTGIFLIFLIIAEILPRFAGAALLPDRAWVFAGTIALFFILCLFSLPVGKNKIFLWLLVLGFSTNIAAAVYINTSKKYMISGQQLASAEWISTNIPSDSTIISFGNDRLLTFFTDDTHTVFIRDPNFYFNYSAFEAKYKQLTNVKADRTAQYNSNLRKAKENILQLERKNMESDTQEILSLIDSIKNLLTSTIVLMNGTPREDATEFGSFYIYYTAPNPKNPYFNRPYSEHLPSKESSIIFNQFPEKFKLIYSHEEEKIYIWEIL